MKGEGNCVHIILVINFYNIQELNLILFYRHDDLIIRNGLYADMWSEQRKSTSDSTTNEEQVAPTNSRETSMSTKNYHHPHVQGIDINNI